MYQIPKSRLRLTKMKWSGPNRILLVTSCSRLAPQLKRLKHWLMVIPITTYTTTNIYHKIAHQVVNKTVNVDEAGNILTSTDG